MSSSKVYLHYILEQIRDLENVTYRSMMGEYLVYMGEKIIAYICDDKLLVKPVQKARELLPNATFEAPYNGAKEMLVVDDVDSSEFLTRFFMEIYEELPLPKKRRSREKLK